MTFASSHARGRIALFVSVLLLGAVASAPAADPADIKVVFSSDRTGNDEIWMVNADGAGLVNLSNAALGDAFPEVSPDKTEILFHALRDGNGEIYVMKIDGSGQVNITHSSDDETDPAWSPDGSKIAFLSAGHLEVLKPHVMNRDGSEKVNLRGDTVFRSYSTPVWSPDGKKVAFATTFDSARDIFTINIDGTDFKNVTQAPGQQADPQWSPDGSQILYRSDQDGNAEVYVINADGTGATNLTNSPRDDRAAEWSPDGSKIVYQSAAPAKNADIFLMNADGSGAVNLTDDPSANQLGPKFSRGGSIIVFSTSANLFAIDPQGGDPVNLTNRLASYTGYTAYEDFVEIASGGIVLANLTPKVSTISPSSIISVFGVNFTDDAILYPNLDGQGRIATTLGGACFEINGARAPIFAVTRTQANLQVTADASFGPLSVVAIRDCDTPQEVRSDPETVTVEQATPAFFLFPPLTNDGNIAARFNSGNAAVAPAGKFQDQYGPSRPAKPGDIIVLYGTGWGPTTANLGTGELAPGPAEVPQANRSVTFGGVVMNPADVFYVGLTPQSAGLYQLAIRVPAGAQPGNNQVVLTVYGKSTPTGPIIPVALP